MIKFWITQTNHNLVENEFWVRKESISINDAEEKEDIYKNPQFKKEFLQYSEFEIGISFFKGSKYKGTGVNFINFEWVNVVYI